MEFSKWLERLEEEPINPFSPHGIGYDDKGMPKKRALRIINRIPPPEAAHLQNALQALDQNNMQDCLSHLQRAMEVYTSSGIQGDQHPNYKMLNMVYEKLTKERHPVEVYKRLLDIALQQVQGELSGMKMK